MTKRLLSLCIAAVSLTLVGCGSDSAPSTPAGLCDKAASVATSVQSKVAPCLTALGGTAPISIPTGTTCTNALTNCSDADRTILNNTLNCLNGLPTCNPSNLTAFGDAASACDPSTKGLSAACQAAF
jgi:hypothetical protein